jgi:FkbM family methyltransferase
MFKEIAKGLARKLGCNLVNVDRLGIDVEHDLKRLANADPIRVIFDVGGNFGQTALRFAAAFPNARVCSFEPVPSSFLQLQRAIQGKGNISAANTAVGEKAGQVSIHVSADAGSNSISRKKAGDDSITVPVDTVDALATSYDFESIDLLKIDVEGYELQVLKGAAGLLAREAIRFVFAECVLPDERDHSHTSFFDLHRFLESNGFCFICYYAESFDLAGATALGNVLYGLRRSLPRSALGRLRNIV